MNNHISKGFKRTYSIRLNVWDFSYKEKGKIYHKQRRLVFCFILDTELKQEMFDCETKGCSLEVRRNVSFSSCSHSIEFL